MAVVNPFLADRELSRHPVDVGTRSEAAIAYALYERGFEVFTPVNVNTRADFLVDLGERVVKIQAKTGRLKNGAITFRLTSTRSNTKRSISRRYLGEVDYFAVYCPETTGVYLVPIEDLSGSSARSVSSLARTIKPAGFAGLATTNSHRSRHKLTPPPG